MLALVNLPRPEDSEMLLAVIVAAAVTAIICSCAMFLHYLREDVEGD
jgi:hypothetical protein